MSSVKTLNFNYETVINTLEELDIKDPYAISFYPSYVAVTVKPEDIIKIVDYKEESIDKVLYGYVTYMQAEYNGIIFSATKSGKGLN